MCDESIYVLQADSHPVRGLIIGRNEPPDVCSPRIMRFGETAGAAVIVVIA